MRNNDVGWDLDSCLPTAKQELIPHLQQWLINNAVLAILFEGIGENGDEPCWCEEGGCDAFLFEVRGQVWIWEAEQPIQHVEVAFESWQLLVEQISQLEPLYDYSKRSES